MISAFVEQVKASQNAQEQVAKSVEIAKRMNKEYFFLNEICEEQALKHARQLDSQKEKKGRLYGVAITVKDNICVKNVKSTAGSFILNNYLPPFNATAINKIEAEGGIVIGKTAMDENGFGSFSTNIGKGFHTPKNPLDSHRTTGGSSGGCGAATALLENHLSLAESTGGSITAPASFCGVVGITPTYGRVSRFGLIDYATSLDKIGTMGKTVYDAALLLEVIQGQDERDQTSSSAKTESLTTQQQTQAKPKIGIPKEFLENVDDKVKQAFWHAIDKTGFECEEFSMPTIQYSLASYYLIAVSEASTNLAKYCGMRYGLQHELAGEKNYREYFSKIRGEGFGLEVKRRLLLGAYARTKGYRGKYYIKALQVRRKLVNEFKQSFQKYDAIFTPSMPMTAPLLSEIKKMTPIENYAADVCTCPPDLAGLPHATLPTEKINGLPTGLQIITDHFKEKTLVDISFEVEETCKK